MRLISIRFTCATAAAILLGSLAVFGAEKPAHPAPAAETAYNPYRVG